MPQFYNRPEYKDARRYLRKNLSLAEILLWSELKSRKFRGLKFRRQHGVDIYVVDLFCPELRLAIEVDGDSHFEPEQMARDERRTTFLRQLGITVIRFRNDEVLEDLHGVLQRLGFFIDTLRSTRVNHPIAPPLKGGDTPL